MGFPGGTSGKNSTCQCRRCKSHSFYPWVGKVPWRRKWQPTPTFLPGESHWQRSVVDYSPQGCRESDTTGWLTHTHTHTYTVNMIKMKICKEVSHLLRLGFSRTPVGVLFVAGALLAFWMGSWGQPALRVRTGTDMPMNGLVNIAKLQRMASGMHLYIFACLGREVVPSLTWTQLSLAPRNC